jgi:predicted DNA-binding transcriptional regulator AlpA
MRKQMSISDLMSTTAPVTSPCAASARQSPTACSTGVNTTNSPRAAAVPGVAAQVDDDGFYDIAFVCAFFGGSRPLHPATIYRGIAVERYPRPVRPSPNINRWVGRELKAAKKAILDAPRGPLPSPKHRAACAA